MFDVRPCALPEEALLQRYRRGGAYTDCYATDLAGSIDHARYVAAFYTTAVFRLERLILRWAASRPSTDAEARQLAAGSSDVFSAWRVEARADDQLLMADSSGRTRSWLMVAALAREAGPRTRLYFGSAVVSVHDAAAGAPRLGLLFEALLGFHKVYSRVLLQAARARLNAGRA